MTVVIVNTWLLNIYLLALNSNFTGSYSFQSAQQNQVINSVVSPVIYTTNMYTLNGSGKLSKHVRYEYGFGHSAYSIKPKNTGQTLSSTTISTSRNRLGLEYNIIKSLHLKAAAKNEVNRNSTGLHANYTFTDLGARYHLEKRKLDFQVDINNLTNIKAYQAAVLSNNTQSDYQYPLRGRNILVKVFFVF